MNRFFRLAVLRIFSSLFELLGLAFLISILSFSVAPGKLALLSARIYSYFNIPLTDRETLIIVSVLCLFAFLVKNGLGLYAQRRSISFAEELTGGLGNRLVTAFLKKGFLYLRNQRIFKITHRTSGLSFEFASVAVKYGILLTSELAVLCIFTVSALIISPLLTLILLLLFIPVAGLVYARLQRRAAVQGQIKNELTPSNNRSLAKLYESYLEMKIYGLEDEFVNRYRKNLGAFNKIRFDQQRLSILPKRILEVIAVTLILGMFLVNQLVDSSMFLLNLGIIGIFAYKIMPSLSSIVDALLVLRSNSNTRTELLENLIPPAKETKPLLSPSIQFNRTIKLKTLSIGYQETLIGDINFEIKKGSITGIKGRTGSGKSSLIKVIMGLMEPLEGQITVDGKQVCIQENDIWLKQFGYIGPDSTIMDGSVYQNVSFGKAQDHDTSRIEKVLKQVQLDEFIGNDRKLTEEGTNLSSGQKQRLALARALYHEPEILVLDEFSANLDYDTENEILQNIRRLNEEKHQTILIVSHRLAPLGLASEIYEINNGHLVKENEK